MTPVTSTAWAASKVLLSNPGMFHNAACTIAAAGSYYLILLDKVAAPADGTDVTAAGGGYLHCLPVTTAAANVTTNLNDTIPGYPSSSGIRCSAGCVVLLSSTVPTSITAVASGLWVNAGVD